MPSLNVRELLENSWKEGYRAGLIAFAYWRNGEQLVGTTGTRLSDALRKIDEDEDIKSHFDLFLDKQRAKHEEK